MENELNENSTETFITPNVVASESVDDTISEKISVVHKKNESEKVKNYKEDINRIVDEKIIKEESKSDKTNKNDETNKNNELDSKKENNEVKGVKTKKEIRLSEVSKEVKDKTKIEKSNKIIEEEKSKIIASEMVITDDESINEKENKPVVLINELEDVKKQNTNDDEDEELAEFALKPVKEIIKVGSNPYIKNLKNFNPNPNDIIVEDIEDTDQEFRKAYFESRNNLLTAPRGVRVPFLMSGYHADISAISHADAISIARHLNNKNYIERLENILNITYAHIISTSKGDLTFEQWIEITKWPDIEAAYFGMYHAAFPGTQKYVITCHRCSNQFDLSVNNEDLAYITGKYIREQDVKVIMSGVDAAIKNTLIYKKANPIEPIKHRLNTTKIYVEYEIPSIKSYVQTLRALSLSDKFEDVANIENPDSPEFVFLRLYPYIKRVALPVIVESENERIVRYKGSYDKNIIISVVDSLSPDDFQDLFSPQEVQDLVTLNSIRYSLKPTKCPHCNNNIRAIPISLKDTFFTKVLEIYELE